MAAPPIDDPKNLAAPLLRIALRLTRNPADAEDLVQETLVAGFQSAERFEKRAQLRTYLTAICKRRWRDRNRNTPPPTRSLDTDDLLPATLSDTNDTEARRLDALRLKDGLRDLPDDLRDAFTRIVIEGHSAREAATLLGIPERTARWRATRAAQHLRAFLTDTD